MRRELITGLALSATLITGCSSESPSESAKNMPAASPTNNLTGIAVPEFPSDTPGKILQRIPQIVKVARDYIALEDMPAEAVGQPEGSALSERGSGVQIGPNQYITAGHILYRYDNKPKANASYCGSTYILAPSVEKNKLLELPEYKGTGPVFEGSTYIVPKHTGTYEKGIASTTPDIAMLQANNQNNIGLKLKTEPVPIASTQPDLGDKLFAINYEPTIKGIDRSPLAADELGLPAIYGQVPIAKLPNGLIVVIEGIKSYGTTEELSSRGGASGGGVFNESGELIGITTGGGAGTKPIEAIEQLFHVDIQSASNQREFSVSFVRPLTAEVLGKLAVELGSAPACSW